MHDWFDTWSGLGLIAAGITHQGWEVQLAAYGARGWRANFFPVGIAHSIVDGLGAGADTAAGAAAGGLGGVLSACHRVGTLGRTQPSWGFHQYTAELGIAGVSPPPPSC
jgi:hypothetical protein